MLTSRPYDEVIERSKTKSIDTRTRTGDKAMIRGYAQRYIGDIIAMLDAVPRQMLLLFKMNDCLRHVDYTLGTPMNNMVVAGKYAARAIFLDAKNSTGFALVRAWVGYVRVLIRINIHEFVLSWRGRSTSI